MSENATVRGLVTEISEGLTKVSASRKDEIRVMQAMLSDPTYEVAVYGKDGVESTYNPTKEFRGMCANIIAKAANVPNAEATQLMENYVATKSDAEAMVGISKEFINTFLQTKRKLPMGAREKSDISLCLKQVAANTRSYPTKIGVNDDGSDRFTKSPTTIPAHESIRVYAPCPAWVK